MSDTLTTKQVEEILALAGAATPVEPRDLTAYEHGGGRLAIIRDGKRDLIADFYGDGEDRDFYAACTPQTVSSLATELLALRKRVGDERKRAVAAIHWVFSADGTVGERAMAQEAIHKINDPSFMPEGRS